MTIKEIIFVVTAFVTFIFGKLAKKFNWVTADIIPAQNLIIGIVAGILAWITGLQTNPASAIIMCTASSLCSGGIYDLGKLGG